MNVESGVLHSKTGSGRRNAVRDRKNRSPGSQINHWRTKQKERMKDLKM